MSDDQTSEVAATAAEIGTSFGQDGAGQEWNADMSRAQIIVVTDSSFKPSPTPSVTRAMLDRVGGEVARATSIVRYAPGSQFPRHVHGGGEEILVLEGVFSDESGDYPAGSYLRHPPGSAHAPFSRDGCVIFVKLWQFCPGDDQTLRIDTRSASFRYTDQPGLAYLPLHSHAGIVTALLRWDAGATREAQPCSGGQELLVTDGTIMVGGQSHGERTWLRHPALAVPTLVAGATGASAFIKIGHLNAPFLTPVGGF